MAPVEIDPAIIRPFDGALPVLALAERTSAGAEYILDLTARTPGTERRDLGAGATGMYRNNRLMAYADPTSGDALMFPELEVLSPGEGLPDRARSVAADLAGNSGLIPSDRTSARVTEPVVLHGSRASTRRTSDAAEYLAFARIRREIQGIPVVGKGSQATVAVSADGIESVAHNWRAAQIVDEVSGQEIDPRQVAEVIVDDLRELAQTQDIRIESVELAYYDGDGAYIQPVFRYQATYGGGDLPVGRILGFVPAVRAFEQLPITLRRPTKFPKLAAPKPIARVRNNRPTIGRYVVRQDNNGWVTSANSFLAGLRAAGTLNGFAPIDRQYYWAEPRLFTDENHAFVDAVQVALTEVHGNWGLFTTLQNNADFVRLANVPADGYGGADGRGALAYWILHSCEVIPTSADTPTSYDVWWNIFNGLHSALGYRTEMWINDEITAKFGFWAGLGAPMISNWLTTVINDDSYSPTDTYFDGNVQMNQPMGRPSAVTVLGHSDDTIFDTAPLSRPSVLQQWWYNN